MAYHYNDEERQGRGYPLDEFNSVPAYHAPHAPSPFPPTGPIPRRHAQTPHYESQYDYAQPQQQQYDHTMSRDPFAEEHHPLNERDHGERDEEFDTPLLQSQQPFGFEGVPGGYSNSTSFSNRNAMMNGEDDNQSIVRYGRIPQRQPRRYKTIKRTVTFLNCSHLHLLTRSRRC